MNVVKSSVSLEFPKSEYEVKNMLRLVEQAARTCYKSQVGPELNTEFIHILLQREHLSVLEHSLVSLKVVCDRGISHEFVRHRIASYSQESTRYCNYSHNKFGSEITVVKPSFLKEGTDLYNTWYQSCLDSERAYFKMLNLGAKPEEARDVLPTSLKTEFIVSMNFRNWMHFLKLRYSKEAHPQMREVAMMANMILSEVFPIIFGGEKKNA